jgi:putative GTP pyrophosphokinase
LYFYHLVNEAIECQERFNTIWQVQDMDAMRELLDHVRELLSNAKKGSEPDGL